MSMAERDLARDLVRRAYHMDAEETGMHGDEGLDEVVRRAGRGPADHDDADLDLGVLPATDRHHVNVRRRRNGLVVLAAAGVAAAVVIGVGVVAARFTGGGQPVGLEPPSPAVSAPASPDWSPGPSQTSRHPSSGPREIDTMLPAEIPSSCASAWTLTFANGTFTVGSRGSACAGLDAGRLWMRDANDCSGLIGPEAGVVQPITGVAGPVSAPFSFKANGIDHLEPGHCYTLTYLHTAILSSASPGADAELFEAYGSQTISLTLAG
jgi:hypothetical protein